MAKLWCWVLFLGLPELLCPSATGRAISPKRNPDTCLISKPHNKILLPLPGEIPPLRRSLGASPCPLAETRPETADRGTVVRWAGGGKGPIPLPSARLHRLTQVPLCRGWPRRDQGLCAQRDASSWGPVACPHLPLSGCSRTAGGGAFLPLPRRLQCGDSDTLWAPFGIGGRALFRRGDHGRLWVVSPSRLGSGYVGVGKKRPWASGARGQGQGAPTGISKVEPGIRVQIGAG